MTGRRLTDEQVELLHHVELSQSGWANRVIDQFVLAACLEASTGLTGEAIRTAVVVTVETATPDQVRRSIDRLKTAKKLVEVDVGRLSPSEATRNDAAAKRTAAAAIEQEARRLWDETASSLSTSLRAKMTWQWVCEAVLDPMVRSQGVRAYELLGATDSKEERNKFLSFLDDIPEDARSDARGAIEAFLASPSVAVRSYVLRQLHAQMLGLAIGLPAGSLEAFQTGSKRVQLKLLLDTNFLFSLLGLHENPSNDAAAELVSLMKAVHSNVAVTLYVTPLTLDEARRTLRAYEARLSEIPVTPRLGEVAAGIDGGLGGIAVKFLNAARSSKKRLTIGDFLGPYLEDLVTVLRSRGIELYNDNLETLSASQPVIDDILSQQAFEDGKSPRKRKSYEALRHDVSLWHLVANRRPSRVDAPLDAVYWIATVDYRLLGFDLHKRKNDPASVPVCVHPSALIQMLQLWLPRNPQLDAALFGGLRASLPHVFDSDAEEMTIRILRALSRYEDVDDIPESTLTSILMNKALRTRMSAEKEVQRQAELVRDEIVKAASSARAALEAERLRATELEAQLAQIRADADARSAAASQALTQAGESAQALQERLDRERAEGKAIEARLHGLEAALASEKADREAAGVKAQVRRARSLFVYRCLLAATCVAAADIYLVIRGGGLAAAKVIVTTGILEVAVWLSAVVLVGNRLPAVAEWSTFVSFRRVAKVALTTAWAIVLGVVGNAIYGWMKQ